MATTSWYSMTISGNSLGDFFSGYLSVDTLTNDVEQVIDPSFLDINILDSSVNPVSGGSYNQFIPGNGLYANTGWLPDGGLVLETVYAIDLSYNADGFVVWQPNGPPSGSFSTTYFMSYRDASTNEWKDILDNNGVLVPFTVTFVLQNGEPAVSSDGFLLTNTCFPAGTPVVTDQGNIPIEKINIKTNTIRNKKINSITKTLIKDKYLICFEKDSLGKNIPSQKTLITKNHKIMHKGVMMKAEEFIENNVNVYKTKYDGKPVYNVLMEEHNKMIINNLICETLDPNNFIAKLHMFLKTKKPKDRLRITKLYNEYILDNNIFDETNKISK